MTKRTNINTCLSIVFTLITWLYFKGTGLLILAIYRDLKHVGPQLMTMTANKIVELTNHCRKLIQFQD
jgi:hypothetical protein